MCERLRVTKLCVCVSQRAVCVCDKVVGDKIVCERAVFVCVCVQVVLDIDV